MSKMGRSTDVFVIGGGPAGLAAAIAARMKGFQVIVADGMRPPIDKACGEGLLPETLISLRELGVDFRPEDGVKFRGIRFLDGPKTVDASFPEGHGLGLRRMILHQRMVDRAQAAGVSLFWNTPVSGLSESGVIVGNDVVRARWIIGADGIRSRVRRWSALDTQKRRESRFAYRRHYHVRPWTDYTEIYWGRQFQVYVTGVGEQETCVVLISRKAGMRLEHALVEVPALAVRLAGARHTSAERGAITAMHSLRRVSRGRAALIGDASGTVDAITGEGIRLSLRQAQALADSLEAGDLDLYEKSHRRLARRPWCMANLMLQLDRRPCFRRRAIAVLATPPDLFARMLAVHVGSASSLQVLTTGARLGWELLTASAKSAKVN